jgi:hypothetical protein
MTDLPGHPRRLALLIGVVHAFLVIAFAVQVAWLAFAGVAQWQLAWRPLQRLDWPVSLLLFSVPTPDGPIGWLPWPLDKPRSFLIPALFFGVVGTLQYMLLGYILGLVRGAFSRPAPAGDAMSHDQVAGQQ